MAKPSKKIQESESPPKKMGRPAYQPTDKDKKQVLIMSGIGLTHDQISKIIGISDETLRKYYADELETGESRMNAQVAQNLFSIATSKDTGAVAAAMFWMKTRAKWRETTRNELTGADGGSIKTEATSKVDWRELDPDQRDVLRQALLAAKGSAK
jgi:hypothetical protein